MSHMSQVSKIVFAIVFLGQVMSSHHSNQISQRSQVSRIVPLGCTLMEVLGRYVGKEVFLGQVMSFHNSNQMSQRSQVSS